MERDCWRGPGGTCIGREGAPRLKLSSLNGPALPCRAGCCINAGKLLGVCSCWCLPACMPGSSVGPWPGSVGPLRHHQDTPSAPVPVLLARLWAGRATACQSVRYLHRKEGSDQALSLLEVGLLMKQGLLLGPFPVTDQGNCYILVAMDCFTKWTEAYAVPDESSTVECLINEMFCHLCAPGVELGGCRVSTAFEGGCGGGTSWMLHETGAHQKRAYDTLCCEEDFFAGQQVWIYCPKRKKGVSLKLSSQ